MISPKDVLACYEQTGSMNKTSRQLGLSPQTVRRILISNGIFPSERVREMTRLRMMGMDVSEIAEYLQISEKTVLSYLPYTKCSYVTGERSLNAERIAESRFQKRRLNLVPRTTPRDRGNASPIATARLAAGLTQAQLAKAVGRSEHSIIRWENGLTHPNTASLLKLSQALGCDPQDLL